MKEGEFMEKPYKKMFSPLFIDLINQKTLKTSDSEEEKEYPLIPGLFNERETYGFILIASKDGKNYVQEFGTEERIDALSVEGERLLIFEEGKRSPWIFNLNGELINEAKFNPRFRSDGEYYFQKYCTLLEDKENQIKKTLS